MIALLRRSASQARYILLGAFVLLCGFQIIIVGQAAQIERTQAFSRMADLLPGFLQRGLGSKAMLLATFKGTVAFGYFHPLVCVIVAVLAMYLTSEPAHEVESGLVDLELARSLPRRALLTRSLLLSVASIVACVLLMGLGTSLGIRIFAAGDLDVPSAGVRARLMINLAALGTCFAGFGLLIGARARRWATAFTIVVLTAVLCYLIDFLAIGWRPMRTIVWISPFHYYPALSIVAGDAASGRDVAILLSAAAIFSAGAYWSFQRRDL
jgi:ABC-type transport system involved in multi-copper enzyme maturation permease subunit